MQNDELKARRITLVDSQGNPRICLEADHPDGRCSITLGSPATGGIQINAAPGQFPKIAMTSPTKFGELSITSEGVALRASDGRLGVILGRGLDGKDDLIVFKDGQIAWRSTDPNGANHATEPPAASGTSAAGHPPRQP
jgi:hypothetical protein